MLGNEISIIIPWRKSSQSDRNVIAKWCFARYRYLFPESEIILCDSNDEVFSRGKSINMGVSMAKGRYVIITDADYLFSPIMAKEIVNKKEWTVGVCKENYLFLESNITKSILDMNISLEINDMLNLEKYTKTCPSMVYGGLLAMPKKNFMKVRFDHNFVGYGYEDNAFYYAMRSYFGEEHRTNHKMYHLYHDHIFEGDYMKKCSDNEKYYNNKYLPIQENNIELRKIVEFYNSGKL